MQDEVKTKRAFHNPYEGMTEVGRVTTDISRADYMLIKLLRPTSGTISGTLGLLWSKLCFELRERNITDNTVVDQFESFVANCRIISNDEYDSLTTESAQWRQYQASRGQLSGVTSSDATAKSRRTARRTVRPTAKQHVGQPTPGLGSSNPAESVVEHNLQIQGGSSVGRTEGGKDE